MEPFIYRLLTFPLLKLFSSFAIKQMLKDQVEKIDFEKGEISSRRLKILLKEISESEKNLSMQKRNLEDIVKVNKEVFYNYSSGCTGQALCFFSNKNEVSNFLQSDILLIDEGQFDLKGEYKIYRLPNHYKMSKNEVDYVKDIMKSYSS